MIENSSECQILIQNISLAIVDDRGFMQNHEEQYKQRGNYIEVLKYAFEKDELYHLYDIWQVLAQAREDATRGFFLDLWDLYELQEGSDEKQRERAILRHFVGQINDQFDEILIAKTITAPKLWQEYVEELLRKLMWIENEEEMQLQRKLLYSMSNLYVYLYPDGSVDEEKDSLIRQLCIAKEAISCKPAGNNSSIVLAEVFNDNDDENSNLQEEFTLSFLYLYRFVNHFAVISLKAFGKKVINSLRQTKFIKEIGQETGEELLERLLRYWGANSPLMRFFLQEKLDFKFYEYAQPEAITLPSPYGTDNFVYTIGASGVGKSYFFHAMDYSSKKSEEQLPLSIEYIDTLEENGLDRKKWEEGEELKERENHLIYMRSKVRNLCRFTFYEIEDTQITGTKWRSLQGYFERRLPSAIVLVFSTEEKDNLKSYDFLVNLLDNLVKKDERYRNIPIYFIFNKSDRLLAKLKQSPESECDGQLLDRLEEYLDSQIELSAKFNFFSLRYQKAVQQIDTIEIVNGTKACCANLAFTAQLSQDIKRVEKIIDSLLGKNFTNLSFTYTCSLFEGNEQRTDLQELWSDLTNFIIKATCEDIKKYYQHEFQTKLERDFQQVDRFYSEAEIKANFEFSKDSEDIDFFELLNETPAPDSQKFKDDFNEINISENISDILLLNSGIESAFNIFAKQKKYLSDSLDVALEKTLLELSIPIKISQDKDFPIKELEFIEPKNYDTIWQFETTSPSVENFLENREYQQITEQIKQVLWENISKYNNNNSNGKRDPLKIPEDHLKIIIEQLPKQLRLIDIDNRNEASEAFEFSIREKFSFSDTLSNKSSLCLIQRGLFEESDRDLIQGTDLGQTVFDRLCQLTDTDTDFNRAKKYCQLLSNYLPKYPNKPKYPQFILVKRQQPPSDKIQVEFDNIKIDILKSLAGKLENQQELLLNMVEILLKNRHELQILYNDNSDEYKKYISSLYTVKYLLEILKSCGFHIEKFQKEPDEIIKKISHIYNELSNPQSMNLDNIREEYQEINLSDKLLSFNPNDIKSSGDKIAAELKTAFNIYTEILKILKLINYDIEQLKSLPKYIIQKFVILQANEYNNILEAYEKQRKMLLIEERVRYLKVSKWIEDLDWLKDSFEEYDFRRNLIDMNREELNDWKQRFIKSIGDLLEDQLFSEGTE
jgi:hypothetical protein